MALLDRYIQAVQQHLPVTRRDDAGRELRELLEDQIATKSNNKGSSLTEKELSTLLKAHGHPYQVANAMLGKRGLISPDAFPLYKRTLINGSALFFMILTLWYLLEIALGNRTIGVEWIADLIKTTVLSLLVGFSGVTLAFHYLGDWFNQRELLWSFNPQRLPAIGAPWVEIKLPQCIGQILFNIAVLFFLSNSSSLHASTNSTGWQVSDIAFYIQIPMFLTVCLHVFNLLQPVWTKAKLWLSAELMVVTGGLLASIIFVDNPFGFGNDSLLHTAIPAMMGLSMIGLAGWQVKRALSGLVSRY